MGSSSARLLEVLSLLQSRPHWSASELAARLGITDRTVRRDINRLRELGYPVVADAGRRGGYELGRGGALPPLLLTDDETVAVAMGLRAAASGGVAGYDEAAVAALAKLEQMLPASLRERVVALNAVTVLTRRSPSGPTVDPEMLLLIAQACRRPERIHFEYRDGSGKLSERRVEPHGLVNVERRWYLVAKDLDRRGWRTFRLDRMSATTATGHRFERLEGPDPATMVRDGLAQTPYPWQAVVVLDTDLASAQAEIPLTVGTVEEQDGEVVLRFGANDVEWLARYLAGLPFPASVRSPVEVRRALRQLGRRLQAANARLPGRRPPGVPPSGTAWSQPPVA